MFLASSEEDSWLKFKDIFLSVLNSVAPVKQVRLKQKSEPWLTSDILEMISLRHCCLFKFKKNKAE